MRINIFFLKSVEERKKKDYSVVTTTESEALICLNEGECLLVRAPGWSEYSHPPCHLWGDHYSVGGTGYATGKFMPLQEAIESGVISQEDADQAPRNGEISERWLQGFMRGRFSSFMSTAEPDSWMWKRPSRSRKTILPDSEGWYHYRHTVRGQVPVDLGSVAHLSGKRSITAEC